VDCVCRPAQTTRRTSPSWCWGTRLTRTKAGAERYPPPQPLRIQLCKLGVCHCEARILYRLFLEQTYCGRCSPNERKGLQLHLFERENSKRDFVVSGKIFAAFPSQFGLFIRDSPRCKRDSQKFGLPADFFWNGLYYDEFSTRIGSFGI